MSDDYKKNADSNAFLKKVQYPSRGVITDRNGKLLVYNQPLLRYYGRDVGATGSRHS